MNFRIILGSALIIASTFAFSDVTFINKSHRGDIVLSYHLCKKTECGELRTIIIPSSNMKISAITINTSITDYDSISVSAAEEKDHNGNIISSSKYSYSNHASHCGYPLTIADNINSASIILDDNDSLPFIICNSNGYIK